MCRAVGTSAVWGPAPHRALRAGHSWEVLLARQGQRQASARHATRTPRARTHDNEGIIPVLARVVREVEAAVRRGPAKPSVRTKFQVVALLVREERARVKADHTNTAAGTAKELKRLDGIATILAGQTTTTITVQTIEDSILEDLEDITVLLTAIAGGDSELTIDAAANSATVTIADDDTAIATITTNDSDAGEAANHGQFTVSISNPSDQDTVINYTVAGSGVAGSDYAPLSGSVVIAAGETSAVIDVTVLDDSILEESETVVITLSSTSDSDVTIGTADTATLILIDDDLMAVIKDAADQHGRINTRLSSHADAADLVLLLIDTKI